ncbi:kinase-like domain-containing protein [Rhizophagus irregularis DAOM 181602=DAOM 197198]|nr:kinase-like domain-containing protein [Rhizophagus irregularis DAOM 181602=DAOM 197198]
MYNKNHFCKIQNDKNNNEWVDWIEEALAKGYFKYYEIETFKNIQVIGSGAFGKVYRANWKNVERYLALKSFFNLDNITVKEIVHELKLQRDVDFHGNVIRFYGITKLELTWTDKYNLAYQLACSVSCLHDEGIVHRDLHSRNVLVHQNSIRLADFGLSKRIDEASRTRSKLLGMTPYIDPKVLLNNNLKLNKKSDVYSIGVLLWEISSGYPPFHYEPNQVSLIYEISQNRREEIIPNTPYNYSNLYTECWNGEPINRPNIHEVVNRLKFILNFSNSITACQRNDMNYMSNQTNSRLREILTPSSTKISLHGELSQMIENFNNMNTNDIDRMTTNRQINVNILSVQLSIVAKEIADLIFREINVRNMVNEKHVFDCLRNHNVNSREIFDWILNDQNNLNSIFLLGYFFYCGIETGRNEYKAFGLFNYASGQGHLLAQRYVGECYEFGRGITKNEDVAYEYYKTLARKGYAMGQFKLGCFFEYGLVVRKNLEIAAYWYEKAAYHGNLVASKALGYLYMVGNGVDENHQKAFELFKKSAEGEDLDGIVLLGNCYSDGIGISIDKPKAAALYQKAACLGHKVAQYNLSIIYDEGVGIEKDLDRAIYWYNRSKEDVSFDDDNHSSVSFSSNSNDNTDDDNDNYDDDDGEEKPILNFRSINEFVSFV